MKLNIEANHATLAGHSFEHEIATAVALGVFGSIDMNRGDPQNGWDTDQFPNDVREITTALYYILQGGGFTTGGNNFDAKLRRQSIDPADLFYAHIGGVDTVARGLLNAAAMIERGELAEIVKERYAGWQGELGRAILDGKMTLEALSDGAVTGRRHAAAALRQAGADREHAGQVYLKCTRVPLIRVGSDYRLPSVGGAGFSLSIRAQLGLFFVLSGNPSVVGQTIAFRGLSCFETPAFVARPRGAAFQAAMPPSPGAFFPGFPAHPPRPSRSISSASSSALSASR